MGPSSLSGSGRKKSDTKYKGSSTWSGTRQSCWPAADCLRATATGRQISPSRLAALLALGSGKQVAEGQQTTNRASNSR